MVGSGASSGVLDEESGLGPDSSSGPTGPLLPARFGRFTLLERIGGGGMATVYRASLSSLGGFEKEVAVKVIRVELAEDPQFTQMFLDEARLSARLNHANIVQTFDFGQEENVHFLAMELVRGRTLAALLKVCRAKGTRLGIGPSLRVAAELARALDYAHRLVDLDGKSLGIVHRDVSPQNVLVSREGEVKLADFGIAKAVMRSHVTQPGRVRGKCAYMAPEQIRGKELDGRADVFALGVILWESLSGRSLFDGASDAAVLHQVLEKEILPPSWFAREVPAEVDALVMRLLSRDVEDRPDSGQASRSLADLIWRVVRSESDIDLAELQRRLSSGTAVYEPAAALASPQVAEGRGRGGQSGARPQSVTLREHHVHSSSPTFEERIEGRSADGVAAPPAGPVDPGAPEAQDGHAIEPSVDPDAETLLSDRHAAVQGKGGSGATTAPVPASRRSMGRGLRQAAALAFVLVVGVGVGIVLQHRGSDWLAAVASPARPAEVGRGGAAPPSAAAGAAVRPDAAAEGRLVPAQGTTIPDAPVSPFAARAVPAGRSGEAEQPELPYMGVLLWGGRPPPLEEEASADRSGEVRASTGTGRGAATVPSRRPPSARAPQGETRARAGEGRRQPALPARGDLLPPGELAISSMLDGVTRVSIDGVPSQTLGRRAPARLTLSAGRHRVTFSHEESGMFCGVVAEIQSGKMLALNADAHGVGILDGAVRTPIPCAERR